MARAVRRAVPLLVLAFAGCRSAAPEQRGVGERVYREGRLASRQPAKALVAGDVPLAGPQAACVSCHQRSGMGSSEGGLVAPPVTRAALYAPVQGRRRNRPAYTDETLARALREGIDPLGQRLDAAMPRYDLPDAELKALVGYLKTLSTAPSPGVTAETIHFATVTTDGIDDSGMLAVLTRYFAEKNGGTRNETRRAQAGPFYLENINRAYRKWVLHAWKLEGPAESWGAQLDAHYRDTPVFAMVSGMSAGPWRPVHDFCQRHRIPCLLPNTDSPVVADDGYYSLYFSQGLTLEGRTVATHLLDRNPSGAVLQVFRDGKPGAKAASAFRETVAHDKRLAVRDLALPADTRQAAEAVAAVLAEGQTVALIAWLPVEDVAALEPLLAAMRDAPRVYLSSTLLRGGVAEIPAAVRRRSFLAHPFSLPSEFRQRFQRAETWLRQRNIPIGDERILAQTYFACRVLGEGMMHITKDYFFRDYFLEFVDHLDAAARFSIAHPRPSFGPGQRYLSKGSYIIDLTRDDPQPERNAQWIVP